MTFQQGKTELGILGIGKDASLLGLFLLAAFSESSGICCSCYSVKFYAASSTGEHVCAYERVSVFLHVVRQFRLEWIRMPCHHMKIKITQPEHRQGIKRRCSEVVGGSAKQILTVVCIAHTSGLVSAL